MRYRQDPCPRHHRACDTAGVWTDATRHVAADGGGARALPRARLSGDSGVLPEPCAGHDLPRKASLAPPGSGARQATQVEAAIIPDEHAPLIVPVAEHDSRD